MSDMNDDMLEPELQAAGRAVARLSRPKAPAGLLARTLERAAQIKPTRKQMLFLRPITHPLARIAAVAMLMVMTVPLTDLDVVDVVGNRIEHNVIGTNAVDRVERIVDELVPQIDSAGYSQIELDAYTGMRSFNTNITKPRDVKRRAHSRV